MISVTQVIENKLKHIPFIEEGLRLHIINYSGLARLIKKQVEKETLKTVKLGTIIMSLRRLAPNLPPRVFDPKSGLDTESDIIVRSNLFEATYPLSEKIISQQKNLFHQIGLQKGLFLAFTQGSYETTIVASAKVKNSVLTTFKEEKPIVIIDNLSSITVRLSKQAIKIPGVFYFLIKALSWENISIVEVVSTFTEFVIILKNEEIDKAFSLLRNLLAKKSSQCP